MCCFRNTIYIFLKYFWAVLLEAVEATRAHVTLVSCLAKTKQNKKNFASENSFFLRVVG